VTSRVSDCCGLDGPSFEKLMLLHYPRRYAASATRSRK
jgi:hypothetical protein